MPINVVTFLEIPRSGQRVPYLNQNDQRSVTSLVSTVDYDPASACYKATAQNGSIYTGPVNNAAASTVTMSAPSVNLSGAQSPPLNPYAAPSMRSFTEWWRAGFGVGTGLGCAFLALLVALSILKLLFGASMYGAFKSMTHPVPAFAPSHSAPYPNYPESIPEPPNPYTPR